MFLLERSPVSTTPKPRVFVAWNVTVVSRERREQHKSEPELLARSELGFAMFQQPRTILVVNWMKPAASYPTATFG